MPLAKTTYFGDLDYLPESYIEFPFGIPGFDSHTRFLFVEQPQSHPLVFVQSLSAPDLCFIAVPVQIIDPDYRLEMAPEDLAALRLPPDRQLRIGEDVVCLTLITVEEQAPPTANLRSPLVVNLKRRIAVQVIHPDAAYSFRHAIGPREELFTCSF
jgi:flagellar assembly factor FliW